MQHLTLVYQTGQSIKRAHFHTQKPRFSHRPPTSAGEKWNSSDDPSTSISRHVWRALLTIYAIKINERKKPPQRLSLRRNIFSCVFLRYILRRTQTIFNWRSPRRLNSPTVTGASGKDQSASGKEAWLVKTDGRPIALRRAFRTECDRYYERCIFAGRWRQLKIIRTLFAFAIVALNAHRNASTAFWRQSRTF